jgi:hypothetical protein
VSANTGASLADGTRAALGRTVFAPVWLALGVVALLSLWGLSIPLWVQYVPFLASVLVVGLPHGAVDHLAAARLGGDRPSHPFAAVAALYLLVGSAYLVAWRLAPAASFALFVALTWFHWGQGDLYVLVALPERTHLRSSLGRGLCLLVRGGLPMIVPLLAFPDTYRAVARTVIELFDPGAVAALEPLFSIPARLALGGGLAALSVVALAVGYHGARNGHERDGNRRLDDRRGSGSHGRSDDGGDGETEADARKRAWRLDAAETVLLWAYFLIVPPILAVGLYFCLWHSLRHVVRVIVLSDDERAAGSEDGTTPAAGAAKKGFVRFAREATPLTAGALVIFAGLYLLAPVTDVSGVLALYLVLLAVLTLPHIIVVSWMDLEQGVWKGRETTGA